MSRLLYIVTHGMSARHLLKGQLAWMREAGFEVAVAAAAGSDLQAVADVEGVEVFSIPIRREIAPAADVCALFALWRLMRRWRPDIVNASTPKAGLLGMLAARAARVPVRVYVLRGLRLETATGFGRVVLAATERMASRCAHRVIAVSDSLARRYVELGLAPADKVTTLGARQSLASSSFPRGAWEREAGTLGARQSLAGPPRRTFPRGAWEREVTTPAGGSSNGVDVARFADRPAGEAAALRNRLGIPVTAPVIGFVGRFTKDKGIVELVEAFERIRSGVPEARLLLVGDFEAGDPVPEATVERIREHPAIVQAGFVADSAPYYGVMDVLAFPSYREGFPNVPLEAAAAGVPVVGFRCTGTVDAVEHDVTGTLVPVGDVVALSETLSQYLADPELRRRHGLAGRERVLRDFRQEVIWEELYQEYVRLLKEKGLAMTGVGNGVIVPALRAS